MLREILSTFGVDGVPDSRMFECKTTQMVEDPFPLAEPGETIDMWTYLFIEIIATPQLRTDILTDLENKRRMLQERKAREMVKA